MDQFLLRISSFCDTKQMHSLTSSNSNKRAGNKSRLFSPKGGKKYDKPEMMNYKTAKHTPKKRKEMRK